MQLESKAAVLTELVRGTFKTFDNDPQPFKPCAWFTLNIDQITVLVRDCTLMEVPSNRGSLLVLFEDNNDEDRIVSFTVDYAYLFCLRHDLVRDGIVILSEMLDAIAGAYPEDRGVCAIAQGILKEYGLTTVAMKV